MNQNKFQKILLLTCSIVLFTISIARTQDSGFVRDGKVLIETGVGFTSILTIGGSSGFNLILDEGESIMNLGLEGGYFVSEDFAIKGQFGIFSVSGSSLINVGAGGKYYIAGRVPVEVMLGIITGEGDTAFSGRIRGGYAIRLADNIALEPSIGGLLIDSDFLFTIGIGFALFL